MFLYSTLLNVYLLLKCPSVFALSLAIQSPNIIFFSETENALEIRIVFLLL